MSDIFSQTVIQLGATTITLGQVLAFCAVAFLCLSVAMIVTLLRFSRARAIALSEAAENARDAEARMVEILRSQAEMQGRMGAIAEVFGTRQAELTQSISQRLDAMSGRLGQTISEQTRATH
ncbi:MAG: DNA recombination protein RmuC, partial [Aquamicrobium sp.]|nr:DNA recombination protein RmuC [Aquamicrobium sp.]